MTQQPRHLDRRQPDAGGECIRAVRAAAMVLVMWVRDDAPQHVLNWRRGADGESRTEKALKRLERKAWIV